MYEHDYEYDFEQEKKGYVEAIIKNEYAFVRSEPIYLQEVTADLNAEQLIALDKDGLYDLVAEFVQTEMEK